MARLRTVLRTVSIAFWREQKSLGSIASNNSFLVIAFLLRKAGSFLYLLAGLVLLFPLSADPLRTIPRDRLALWPLSGRERTWLRLVSPLLNPLTWLVLGAAVWALRGRVTAGLFLALAAAFLVGFLLPSVAPDTRDNTLRRVPHFPGRLNQLIRKNIREILQTLDFYCALALSLAGGLYRFLAHDVPAEALLGLTILIVLILSSLAQCLFGLEGETHFTRYRLLPVKFWELLLAKGMAWLLLVVVLTLPFAPLAGLAGGLAALAVGQYASVTEERQQTRWRFSTGGSIGNGIVQIFAMCGAAVTTYRMTPAVVLLAAAVYAASLWYCRGSAQSREDEAR